MSVICERNKSIKCYYNTWAQNCSHFRRTAPECVARIWWHTHTLTCWLALAHTQQTYRVDGIYGAIDGLVCAGAERSCVRHAYVWNACGRRRHKCGCLFVCCCAGGCVWFVVRGHQRRRRGPQTLRCDSFAQRTLMEACLFCHCIQRICRWHNCCWHNRTLCRNCIQ